MLTRSIFAGEQRNEVMAALDKLSEDHKEILILRYYDDLSYSGIAEVLQVKLGTVMSRLSQARVRLLDVVQPATWSTKGVNMDCTTVSSRVAAFLDGEMDAGECERFVLHIEGCEPCTRLVASSRPGRAAERRREEVHLRSSRVLVRHGLGIGHPHGPDGLGQDGLPGAVVQPTCRTPCPHDSRLRCSDGARGGLGSAAAGACVQRRARHRTPGAATGARAQTRGSTGADSGRARQHKVVNYTPERGTF